MRGIESKMRGTPLGRTRQRGAVAVEGVIVVVMMVAVVSGIWFMREVYSGKLVTMQVSRAGAWKVALDGCVGGEEGKLYPPIHDESKDPNAKICKEPDSCEDSSVEGLSDDGTTDPPPDWFPAASGDEVSKSVSVSSDPHSATLITMRQFSCNEKPSKWLQLGSTDLLGEVADVVKKIIDEQVPPDTTAQKCQINPLICCAHAPVAGCGHKWHDIPCDSTSYKDKSRGDPLHCYSRKVDLTIDTPPPT
jgi:hypothetical protein